MINSAYHFASERTNRTEKGKQVNNFPAWICYLEIGYGLGSVVMLPNSRPDAHCSKISTQEANMGLKKKLGRGELIESEKLVIWEGGWLVFQKPTHRFLLL